MGEKSDIRVKFEIGEIKFEAEGSAELVERERSIFNNTLLPAAIDAIVRTRGVAQSVQCTEAQELPQPTLLATTNDSTLPEQTVTNPTVDLSRTSLASFVKEFGTLSEQDFVLVAAFYYEKKDNIKIFSSESVKQYYADARRPKYSNNSELLKQLAQKGFIMDDPNAEKRVPKQYILTENGIGYVETYQPKDDSVEKPKTPKAKRPRNKVASVYSVLNADDLNLKNYPVIKDQNTFKKQMILILYIVTTEGKGDSFSVADIQYLMTDMLGLPATKHQIDGIFTKNKSWFKSEQDPDNKKAYKRRLLQGAKDFALSIIDGVVE